MKIKKITGFICAFFIAQLSFGQVTLEQAYKGLAEPVYKEYGDDLACNYVSADKTGTITIYNLDHSINKTIKFDIPKNVELVQVRAYSLYSNVINVDPLLELYYLITYRDSNNDYFYEGCIVNENGNLIKKIEDCGSFHIIATENGFKLRKYGVENGDEIYYLPTIPNKISVPRSESVERPFPNPANQIINIPYKLSDHWGIISIYNATGQLIEQKNVDKNFSNLLLNVSDYAKGMYFYKVGKQKGEFLVN